MPSGQQYGPTTRRRRFWQSLSGSFAGSSHDWPAAAGVRTVKRMDRWLRRRDSTLRSERLALAFTPATAHAHDLTVNLHSLPPLPRFIGTLTLLVHRVAGSVCGLRYAQKLSDARRPAGEDVGGPHPENPYPLRLVRTSCSVPAMGSALRLLDRRIPSCTAVGVLLLLYSHRLGWVDAFNRCVQICG